MERSVTSVCLPFFTLIGLDGLKGTGRGPVIDVRVNALSDPSTDSITFFNFEIERLTLLICRDGQREIPCCLQMRFIVVGHTVKKQKKKNNIQTYKLTKYAEIHNLNT
jgi:hypothetical protein